MHCKLNSPTSSCWFRSLQHRFLSICALSSLFNFLDLWSANEVVPPWLDCCL